MVARLLWSDGATALLAGGPGQAAGKLGIPGVGYSVWAGTHSALRVPSLGGRVQEIWEGHHPKMYHHCYSCVYGFFPTNYPLVLK